MKKLSNFPPSRCDFLRFEESWKAKVIKEHVTIRPGNFHPSRYSRYKLNFPLFPPVDEGLLGCENARCAGSEGVVICTLAARQLFNNVLAYGTTTFLRCAPLIPCNYYEIDVCRVFPSFVSIERIKSGRANCMWDFTCVLKSNTQLAHNSNSYLCSVIKKW